MEDLESPFHILAGPGAGKTHWLSLHLQQLALRSTRLGSCQKIACISYTNIAVAEIRRRIGDANHKVEASTIHSFLYANLVRPYLHLLCEKPEFAELNHRRVDGHDEHRPNYGLVNEWHLNVNKKFLAEKPASYAYLKSLRWVRDDAKATWSLKPGSPRGLVPLLPTKSLHLYKPVYWKRGVVDHEDILYFAYILFESHPELRPFISAKFPYIVVDEFQDTNPVQVQILKWLGEVGSVVGVIGDTAQSIYSFQGASPKDFAEFNLDNLSFFEINGNRRSSNAIIGFLNRFRHDGLHQEAVRNTPGFPVEIHIGSPFEVLAKQQDALPNSRIVGLARKHAGVAEFSNGGNGAGSKPWQKLSEIDQNRSEFLEKVTRGALLFHNQQFGAGLRELLSALRLRGNKFREPVKNPGDIRDLQRRGLAVATAEFLTTQMGRLRTLTLLAVYQELSSHLGVTLSGTSLTRVTQGAFRIFAEANLFGTLCDSVRSPDARSDLRTIHQAKGDEFENVIVKFDTEAELLDFLFHPNLKEKEGHRIYYVAASRARDRLTLLLPSASDDLKAKLKTLDWIELKAT